jgi:triacylglycerol lipase
MNTETLVFIIFILLALVAVAVVRRGRSRAKTHDGSAISAEQAPPPVVLIEERDQASAAEPQQPAAPAPVEISPQDSERLELERVAPPTLTLHPIVLAHGLGFDTITFGKLRHEYFRGVPQRLRALGVDVHVLRVPPFAGIRKRAEHLARQIVSLPVERVNIIAHSMGGLDARYAISHLGIAPRVASLTTIGTPHHGAPLATVTALLLRAAIRRVLATADLDGVYDLTPESMARFNREVPDAPGVEYTCCIGSIRPPSIRGLTSLPLLPAAGAMGSDGLVPCNSQRWGAVLCEIDADHWAQIGWSPRFDAASFYADIVRRLGERGL